MDGLYVGKIPSDTTRKTAKRVPGQFGGVSDAGPERHLVGERDGCRIRGGPAASPALLLTRREVVRLYYLQRPQLVLYPSSRIRGRYRVRHRFLD